MTQSVILWRTLVWPGHESAMLDSENDGWRLTGSAVFQHEGQPCRLNYHILAADPLTP